MIERLRQVEGEEKTSSIFAFVNNNKVIREEVECQSEGKREKKKLTFRSINWIQE
jgi:hypothetical protein